MEIYRGKYQLHEILPGIIGDDPLLHSLASQIKKIAITDKAVLLKGETGCGKELFASAIHELSNRQGNFVAVNCAAIPENLFESLLFGHEKGAFTGADKRQHGFFAQANGGTLFLDEIAELPVMHQSKLLRVLESRKFSRIGSHDEIEFSGRIVTASHADLKKLVGERLFREDLYYRLNLFELEIPSLEQRRDDIPLLVRHFTRHLENIRFSECALEYLKCSKWPGNIRQLRNTIEKITVLAEVNLITEENIRKILNLKQDTNLVTKIARELISMPDGNKIMIICDALVEEAVTISGGNKTKAALLLGVHRKVVERRMFQMESREG